MNSIEKLTEIFSHFPGIGPRQAKRFVYYLLTRNNNTINDLVENISSLKKDISVCSDCKRFYERVNKNSNLCNICSDENRDHTLLMIVPRDSDLESVEKNSVFNGIYFVLGGILPILEKEPEKKVRSNELIEFLNNKKNITEIILGMNFTPEGENTADYIRKIIEEALRQAQGPEHPIKISVLGKGLSMGTELEYADSETLKNALKNRS